MIPYPPAAADLYARHRDSLKHEEPVCDSAQTDLCRNPPSDEGGKIPSRDIEHQRLDGLERAILDNLPAVHMPVIHRFTPGLYAREIFMPAGTLLLSKIHNTRHPYVVLSGIARVIVAGQPVVELHGGHVGITEPGTRRVLLIVEHCRWITFHPLTAEEDNLRALGAGEEELLAKIEARIIEKRERADGRDIHAEYCQALSELGLPGPNDGPPALPEEV